MEEIKKNSVTLEELEKELDTAEAIRLQVENAMQQILGKISCLRSLIKRAKGELPPPKINEKEEKK